MKLIVLMLGCLPLIASAQIYRWLDPSGQVHFTQTPPKNGVYKDVTPTPSSVAPSPKSQARLSANNSAGEDQLTRTRADNAERCAKVRERVSFLEGKTAQRLFKTGEDGRPAPLTQEEFDQQLNDAKAASEKYCI